MGKRVLVLGGGFGGIAGARRVRALLPDADEVVLVDRAADFMMGFRKTGIIVGRDSAADGTRPLAALRAHGIDVRRGEITQIDADARAIVLDGERIEADAMLIALGAERDAAAIPGLAEHGIDVYDKRNGEAARAALTRDTGTLVVGIFGNPYTCPPAPYELTMLAQDVARANGSQLQFRVITPLPMSLPVLGKTGCEAIEGRLVGRFIEFTPDCVTERVDAGVLRASSGDIAFDVLFAIPPHRVPPVIAETGLTGPSGWIAVDPRTLATKAAGVWAVGDCTAIPTADGKQMPKAGELAAVAAEVAAEHIAAHVTGGSTDAQFWGDGRCFLEIGDGEAMVVQGRFLAEGGPEVVLTNPSPDHLAEKQAYERDRLAEWFGA